MSFTDTHVVSFKTIIFYRLHYILLSFQLPQGRSNTASSIQIFQLRKSKKSAAASTRGVFSR